MMALLQKVDLAGEARSLTGWQLRGRFRVLPQISRYAVVSLMALVLDYATYLSLVWTGTWPTLAGITGYSLGLALHFLLSLAFVFPVTAAHKPPSRLFGEFVLSGLAGLAMTAAVIATATDLIGLPAIAAKLLATGTSFFVVYALRRGIVFAPR
jgi:putative flippase GtrA